jgi:hypothetical protein
MDVQLGLTPYGTSIENIRELQTVCNSASAIQTVSVNCQQHYCGIGIISVVSGKCITNPVSNPKKEKHVFISHVRYPPAPSGGGLEYLHRSPCES